LLLSIFYLLIRCFDIIILSQPYFGDEYYYTNDLRYFITHGYKKSLIHGISIPTTLLSYLFLKVTNSISVSLRLANASFVLLLICYFYFRVNLFSGNKSLFIFYLFLLIGTTGGMFYGTADSLFFTSLLIFIFESYLCLFKAEENKAYCILSSTLFILARPHVIIYLPIILLGYISYRNLSKNNPVVKKEKYILSYLLAGLIIVLLCNYPRFSIAKYSLSYTNKLGTYKTSDPNFNWIQWHYYSQMIGNNNGLGFFSPMLYWEEVREYKLLNNAVTLPKNIMGYLTEHPLFVLRRIPTSIIESLIISLRYVGILLLLLPYYIYKKFDNRDLDSNMLFALIILVGFIIWSAIFPHVVQHRWYFPFYVMLIFIFSNDSNKLQLNKIMFFNMILLNIITLWALWKEKLFYSI